MFKLRPYQQDTVDLILENIKKGIKSQLINSPTGSGKTVISSELVSQLVASGKSVFFIVANEPLVMQTYDKFVKIGLYPSIIKAGYEKYYNEYSKVQIVMIQSYTARMKKMPNLHADVLIIDEVDFGYSGGMLKKVREKHDNAQIIGLTGTPIDFKGYLLDGFDFYHEVVTVRELQKEGFLAQDKNYIPLTPDLKNVRVMKTGDFNEEDLDEACNKTYIIEDIIKTYKQVDCGFKGILFAINIDHGMKIQELFNKAGIKTGLVHSKMKKFQIDYWMEAFKHGRIRLLVNIGKLTRGFDQVDIKDVIMCRPTMSLALYLQIVGRGARITEGKDFFRLFDYAGNIERHGLWSEPRIYARSDEPKKEVTYRPIVCPNCFSVIMTRNNSRCPECDFIIKQQQERREREIEETARTEQVIEIKAEYGASGAIDALTRLLGYNANTFYYTKLLAKKPQNINIDSFNAEVCRLANYARRQHYNPYYVVHKVMEKINT